MLVPSTIITQRDGNLPVFSVVSVMSGAICSTTKTRGPGVVFSNQEIDYVHPLGKIRPRIFLKVTLHLNVSYVADADEDV